MRLLRSNFPPVLLGIALLLAGCGPLENATTPISTLHPMRVAYSPDTRPALLALEQCAAHQPDLMALFDEMPVALMGSSPTDVWIRLGTPENWGGYAAQLAEERIGVVVNPDNPIQSLSLEEMRGVFSGQLQSWSQVGGSDLPIQVWVLPAADEASQISDKNLFGGLTISSQAYLATGPSLMLQAIANDPGAIGYLPGAWIELFC